MNNVIPETIFDKAGEVIDTIADRQKANDKAWSKAARAYKKSEYDPALSAPVDAGSQLSHQLSDLRGLINGAMSLALGFDSITEDPTGDFTALATEYAGLFDRIAEAVAKANDAIDGNLG